IMTTVPLPEPTAETPRVEEQFALSIEAPKRDRSKAKLKELVANSKLDGVTGFTNYSDMHGLRLQIDVRAGLNPRAILDELYRVTPLEETFGINNVVLVDGVPTTVGIRELCEHYISHRLDVVERRTRFRLDKARDRLHILEGLLIALDAIDEVVAIIRSSQDVAEARERLIERFGLSQVQAAHILDMPLRRLTALARLELEDEAAGRRAEIADYEKILGSERRRRTLVLKELQELVDAYGRDRHTEIVAADEIPVHEGPIRTDTGPADVVEEPCRITLSTSGNLGRAPAEGARRAPVGRHDLIAASVFTTTTSPVVAVTSHGRALGFRAGDVADASGRTRGGDVVRLLGLNRGEAVLDLVATGDEHLVIVTANGVVKRLTNDEVLRTRSGRTVIGLKPGDSAVAALRAPGGVDVAIVASDGQTLRLDIDSVSVQGRGAAGVAGIKLRPGATVVGAAALLGDGALVTVTSCGAVKATAFGELPVKGRGGQGVRIARLGDGERLTIVQVGDAGEGLLAQMVRDDDHRKLDPNPVVLHVEQTRRDLVPTATERQVLVLAPARW
ncbi:MAG: DNA gyrase subunit A, partial [Acidimicrobiales bacterium]